jgi:16S rRNA (cytosine1402-N4)-methyltransferase
MAKQPSHTPVLLHEVVHELQLRPADVVLDATLGGAGHARAIAEKLAPSGTFIGMDADSAAIERAREKLQGVAPAVHLVHANFRFIRESLSKLGIPRIDKALFDLGWSSYQLASGRGFSFRTDDPLLMTYADAPKVGDVTAEQIVNDWQEESIADVLYGWGEERHSRRIAKAIVEARAQKPITTARELAEIIEKATPLRASRGKIHPATRTFQALRIAVNDELGALKEGLIAALGALGEGGRIAVISFHSVEDREVKRLMMAWEKAGAGKRVTKSPLAPTKEESMSNPRARSAKLRVIEKIKE